MDLTLEQWIAVGVGAANLLVAGGTFFLAWKTRDMARETKEVAVATAAEADKVGRQAEVAERQIELSRSALDASIRPWLTKSTRGTIDTTGYTAAITIAVWDSASDARVVRMEIRNVGPGIALIQSGPEFRIEGPGPDPSSAVVIRHGFAAASALPPGEETTVSFVLEHIDLVTFLSQDRNDGEFNVWIPYTDTNGSQRVEARVHAAFSRARGEWLFHKIDYFATGPEQEPFATVIFDAAVW